MADTPDSKPPIEVRVWCVWDGTYWHATTTGKPPGKWAISTVTRCKRQLRGDALLDKNTNHCEPTCARCYDRAHRRPMKGMFETKYERKQRRRRELAGRYATILEAERASGMRCGNCDRLRSRDWVYCPFCGGKLMSI